MTAETNTVLTVGAKDRQRDHSISLQLCMGGQQGTVLVGLLSSSSAWSQGPPGCLSPSQSGLLFHLPRALPAVPRRYLTHEFVRMVRLIAAAEPWIRDLVRRPLV